MPKQKPPGTTTHTIFLPDELHRKIAAMVKHGEADDLIIECVAEGIEPRWRRWLNQESMKLEKSAR